MEKITKEEATKEITASEEKCIRTINEILNSTESKKEKLIKIRRKISAHHGLEHSLNRQANQQ